MLRTKELGRGVGLALALLGVGLLGCDADSPERGTGTGGTGGLVAFDSGMGGLLPDSGGILVGGGDGGVDAGAPADAGCPWDGVPRYDLTTFDVCDQCENAHCAPIGALTEAQIASLSPCDEFTMCVPDSLIVSGGLSVPKSCTSLQGAEGRCMSLCVPAVAAQKDTLPTEGCASDERCAPCFDPVTGEDTGACTLTCDPGPGSPATLFPECCGGLSVCVPTELVSEDQRADLDATGCTGTDVLCAPKTIASDSNYVPPGCMSVGGTEGRCLPACLPSVAEDADRLMQGSCEAEHLCAPCYDPLTGADTGACTIGPDLPINPPYTFPTCCDANGTDVGTCVPTALVPADQQALLGADTCTGAGELCAPTDIANGVYVAVDCDSIGGGEGRCLPACLPDVAAQADTLPQGSCAAGYLCAPCFDPLTGEDTGSCTLEGDAPVETPFRFETCCDAAGTDVGSCVPLALVPVDQQALLDVDTCTGTGVLCAPNDLAGGSYVPQVCDSLAGAEGRCLPACLPDVAARADKLPQSSCDAGYLCAPCFDPLDGTDTGSCALEGDAPTEPPVVFDECCNVAGTDVGVCVPLSSVPVDQQGLLDVDSCTGTDVVCAPRSLADGSYAPVDCNSLGGGEGRCLPTCLPDVAAQADKLPQDSCAAGYLCAPCTDPLTGADTGSCTLEGDTPQEPPFRFEGCCDAAGTDVGSCVPTSLVPVDQQSLLGVDTCSGSGVLCAPNDIAGGTYVPEDCDSLGGGEGRCLPACLPDVAAQADKLPQSSCAAGYLCAPCFDPVTGVDTGSCTLEGDTPKEPKYVFPTCCNDSGTALGTCVPTSTVPVGQQGLLGRDDCATGNLCAPTPIAAGTYVPEVCDSWLGAEGRCLPSCLPDVAAQASRLKVDSCGTGELCVPCFDPLDGTSTGACTLEGDVPTNNTPVRFPTCCPTNGTQRGTCVPTAAAGSAGAAAPVLTCETATNDADAYICAPNEFIAVPPQDFAPSCTTQYVCPNPINILGCALEGALINGQPGVCAPACLLAEQGNTPLTGAPIASVYAKTAACATGEVCAPCTDPQDSTATGLCP